MYVYLSGRNELLLPILDPSYVVRRIIRGITTDMTVLYMPWLVSCLHLLKCFPLAAQNVLSDMLGVGSTMDEFKVGGGHSVPNVAWCLMLVCLS